MNETDSTTDGMEQSEEPYWVIVAKLSEQEYATTVVDAPTEDQANVEGQRVIAVGEGTAEYDVRSVRGPFPKRPGEAAPKVRPDGCQGCGLHCWDAAQPPCPNSTWFERDDTREDSVAWRCITCGTITAVPDEVLDA